MFCNEYTIPTTATTVAELIYSELSDIRKNVADSGVMLQDIIIQAPATNSSNIFYGDENNQKVFIKPEGSSGLFKANIAKLSVIGTGTDKIIIFLA